MVGKVLIFTGAPESALLDWDTSGLLHEFQAPIANFFGLNLISHTTEHTTSNDETSLDLAAWRSLPLERVHVPTGFSQRHDLDFIGHFPSSADFLTTASISFEAASQGLNEDSDIPQRLLSQFYEYSLAVHGDVPSSQLGPPEDEDTRMEGSEQPSFETTTSFESTDSLDEASLAEDVTVKGPLTADRMDHLSDLEDLPNATYLTKIEPQTMSVTLICGIISIASPKTVENRWGGTSTLVEMLVGDDTKSGFSVTFWLDDRNSVVKSVLAGLRAQDIVMMRHVGLRVFRNKVYGQGLRKDTTKVHLLHRRKLDASDRGGYYSTAELNSSGRVHPQLDKTRKVNDWVLHFVGGLTKRKTAKGQQARPWDRPPPLDSQ